MLVPTTRAAEETGGRGMWAFCPTTGFDIPERPAYDPSLERGQVEIEADRADMTEGEVSDFWGDVTFIDRQQAAQADHARYFSDDERAELEGNVQLWDDSQYLNSDTATIQLDEEHGTFYNARYWFPLRHGRGESDSLYREGDHLTRLKNADYTTCPVDGEFWKIYASELNLDHDAEQGTAKHVVLRIKDIPVFYTPYASFPLSDKRKSGFLPPSIGAGSRTGFDLSTPYYWNIAPQMDATFGPRVMSDRGIMAFGEFRYLFETGEGEIDAEYLPSDSGSDLGDRGIFSVLHEQSFFDGRGSLDIDYANASDRFYLEDFGTSLDVTSTSYLLQRARTRYNGSWWYASANVQAYDIVNSNRIVEPYKRLPQLRFGSRMYPENWQPNFQFETEAVYFTRDDAGLTASDRLRDVNGARYDVMPSVSYPMRGLGGYVEPKIGMRYTQYNLHGDDVLSGPDSFNDNPSRTLPFASLDSGLFFERDFSLADSSFKQTLEPRLFYLYVPYENQDDLPIFDTNLYDVSFAQLFRENRFSGADRFGDANQLTLAVTSRIIDNERGRELGRLSLGQIVYFEDREVTLPGLIEDDDDVSPIVAEAATTLIPNWEAVGTIYWDPEDSRTEKLAARLSYNNDGRILNLSYRQRRDQRQQLRADFDPTITTNNLLSVEQTDISFRWPVSRQWSVVGRWNYALPESKTLELFGGVEYEDCCWAFRAVARHYINSVNINRNSTGADDEYSTGFFLQLELKGLTGIGSRANQFLERSIRGYDPDQF